MPLFQVPCCPYSRKHGWQCLGDQKSVSSEHLIGCCKRLPLASLVAAEVPAQHHRRRCHPEPAGPRSSFEITAWAWLSSSGSFTSTAGAFRPKRNSIRALLSTSPCTPRTTPQPISHPQKQ